MPLYTYRCSNCGVQFDERQRFDEPALEQCPECGKKTLRKLFLPVGIVFKGSGFYTTDHRSTSGANGTQRSEKVADAEKAEKPKAKTTKPDPKSSETPD